ncbi:MAG TPA: DUF4382 domain-containing protein [Terracidiphilus sp.]|nr:DUF4382 domain-containing protein [Terracidiphilus sp.]
MNMERGNDSSYSLWKLSLVLGCLLVAALVVASCTSGNVSTASGMGSVSVKISDPATCQAPNGPFSHVYVTITDVQANMSSTAGPTDSTWVDLTPNLPPMQIDLLGPVKDQCFLATLGDSLQLQAGTYQQIRLMLAPNTATVSGNMCGSATNCVTLTSDKSVPPTPYPLLLSSEAQTGIKIPSGQIASGGFTIAAGKTQDLDIDFLTCMSIVQEGNGQYRLKPVLHAAEVGTTSVSLNGKVTDAAGNPVAGAMVAVEQPSGTDTNGHPIDRFLDAVTTGLDGTWVICPLVYGDTTKPYDVVVIGSSSTGILFAPSIVTGVGIGDAVGTIKLYASASATTAALSTATITGQVTSVNNSLAGVVIDAYLSVLETVNSVDYTILLPMTATQIGGPNALVTTSSSPQTPPCNPLSADCINYSLQTQATGAYIGAWSAGGATLAQPNLLPVYMVDGNATVTGLTTTPDCSPSEKISSAVTLAGSPLAGTANLAFTGCS